MKRIVSLLSFVLLSISVTAQSVLITPGAQSVNGDSTSQDQLNVFGNGLLVAPKTKFTEDDPASDVYTMSCLEDTEISSLAGTLKDPGADSDYSNGISHNCSFTFLGGAFGVLGYQIYFESFETESDGDTLYLIGSNGIIGAFSGSEIPASLIINSTSVEVQFKTDNDLNVGSGFVLKWKAILLDGFPSEIQNYNGLGLVFDMASQALWLGDHSLSDFENRGIFSIATGFSTKATGSISTAMGSNTEASGGVAMAMGSRTKATGENSTVMGFYSDASGNISTAMGDFTIASGDYSTAMGSRSRAFGDYSTAMGSFTEASGEYSIATGKGTEASGENSTAMGNSTEASGDNSTAVGFNTEASGNYSIAMGIHAKSSGLYSNAIGTRVRTNNYQGAMALGDYVGNLEDTLSADASNRFLARFDNGYKLYTNSDLSASTIGLMALHNANSWSSISDSTKKENFIASNGENVLNSVAQMRIGTWNYKGQNPNKHRHWGVMAQDFHNHFGKDAYGTIGNDTTIATADFDGVSFAAIKALEARTRELQEELAREKRFSASLELTTERQGETIKELQEQLLSIRSESMSVRAESRTVQAESKALKEDFKELKEMLMKSVAVKQD